MEKREHEEDGSPAELAAWLEESGRRRHNAAWVASLYAGTSEVPTSAAVQPAPYITQPTLLYLFAMCAVAYLLYYFAGVQVEIISMSTVITFLGS